MFRFTSFSLINSFRRKTCEFYEDYLIVKVKSLTVSYEKEIEYEKIKAIRNIKMANLDWHWASFATLVLLRVAHIGLSYFSLVTPTVQFIEKVIVVFALIVLIPGFRKHEYYSFLNANNNYLATVEVNNKTRGLLLEAIDLVKRKTALISKYDLRDALPSTRPIHQFVEFDFPDFLNKSQVMFYDDKLIVIQKSLAEEETTVIKYQEFSGKTKVVKTVNDKWDYVWSYWLGFVCVVGFSMLVLFSEQTRGNLFFAQLFAGGLILIIPLFLLRYIKRDILVFYDHNDNSIFWTWINSAYREKLNEIVAFVQEKVAPENIKPA